MSDNKHSGEMGMLIHSKWRENGTTSVEESLAISTKITDSDSIPRSGKYPIDITTHVYQ